MTKKEAVRIFTEDILPGIRTKELRQSCVRSYKEGVNVDSHLRCEAWSYFCNTLDSLGIGGHDRWHDHWSAPGVCYLSLERRLKYYDRAGIKQKTS